MQAVVTNYYTLTFSYTFESSTDCVYFAHCFPYTYTDLQTYLSKAQACITLKPYFYSDQLCRTIIGNKINILTITQNVSEYLNQEEKLKADIQAAQAAEAQSNLSSNSDGDDRYNNLNSSSDEY